MSMNMTKISNTGVQRILVVTERLVCEIDGIICLFRNMALDPFEF